MKQSFATVVKIFIFLIVASCSKKPVIIQEPLIEIEQLRRPGMTDYELLQRMVDSLPENSQIKLSNKTYTVDHTVIVTKSLNFIGPAILKREDQITYRLMESANENSRYLILDKTNGLRVPDRFLLASDVSYKNTTQINVILKISGDTVFLNNPIGKKVDLSSDFPTGTELFKNISFFWIVDPVEYPRQKCSFINITFDGNKENNSGSYSWLLNASVMALTKGPTSYKTCTFINSPGETIVGHNADIRNCKFMNLNGSAFHTSADKMYNTEEEISSYLDNNIFVNTNQISTTIGGHSEGCITHSNSGGYYTAVNNTFINVGESIIGALYPSLHQHDWGTSNIIFENNTINTVGRMVYLIDTITSGTIHNVRIEDNDIQQLNGRDWSDELNHYQDVIIENEVNQ